MRASACSLVSTPFGDDGQVEGVAETDDCFDDFEVLLSWLMPETKVRSSLRMVDREPRMYDRLDQPVPKSPMAIAPPRSWRSPMVTCRCR